MTLTDPEIQPTASPRTTLADLRVPGAARPRGVGSLEPDTEVEVRNSFDQRWTPGFAVIRLSEQGYRLRRLSDGEALPGFFAPDDVRKERRRGTWWY